MNFLQASYNPWVVAISFLTASFASFVALDLAKRVRTDDRRIALLWWVGGSVTMGTGIWCMHFVGMLAYALPIALGYTPGLTLASWLAGVGVSAVALHVAGRPTVRPLLLAASSLVMGLGICAMHYAGMAALDMVPGIVWDPWLILASVVIGVAASAVALSIFSWMRSGAARDSLAVQVAAAAVMGIAICGMHYTGMAAASFPVGSVCLSRDALGGASLGALVVLATASLLAMTLFTSKIDARAQGRTRQLAESLSDANDLLTAANRALEDRALLDPLTGLPNRLYFEDRLRQALTRIARAGARAERHGTARIAVLFMDLDGFKPVNDSFGHAAGDDVLKQVAMRLRSTAREGDTAARIGGDEFVLLMEDVQGVADCVVAANRLLQAIALPIDVADRVIELSGSIGIIVHPDQGDPTKLVAQADAAMYEAKRHGGNAFAVFESHMDAEITEQLVLRNDLRHAIDRGQLLLHYQPKVDCSTGQIRGVEALLRWCHPVRGQVSPNAFIPIAERYGLIGGIGNWVIGEACRQMQAWDAHGVRLRVAINLSVHQLREADLVERIAAELSRHAIDPSRLLCEITESAAMDDIRAMQKVFEGFARIGVFLSIDDFGTGYSSLSYLRQLPAQQLKIDRSFVSDIEQSADARAIVNAVIQLAHALGLRVVAEGVETAGQRDILVQHGCDEMQGYFYAKPMSPAALLRWAQGQKPADAVDFSASTLAPLQP